MDETRDDSPHGRIHLQGGKTMLPSLITSHPQAPHFESLWTWKIGYRFVAFTSFQKLSRKNAVDVQIMTMTAMC